MPETKETPKTQVSWSAPEFVHYPKSLGWFLTVGLMGLVFAVYFFWQKEFLTATLFVLILLAIFYFSRLPPKTLKIEIDKRGIKLNQAQIPYQQIKSFWIVYEPPYVKTVNFETTAHLNRFLTLQLANQDPVEVRRFLLEHLPEDLERGEQFADKLSRTLKF